jgi:predicted transcriptional regulator
MRNRNPDPTNDLSRRERQIMDALYRSGTATAVEVRDGMPDPPTSTAVRTLLTILEQKGLVRHREDGPRYVYEPVVPRNEVALASLQRVLQTFFEGSLEHAVSTLLYQKETRITDAQLERLASMIEKARSEGR